MAKKEEIAESFSWDFMKFRLWKAIPIRHTQTRPHGEWQSYDILFNAPEYKDGKVVKPATVTVMHNGIIVHNAQPYKRTYSFQKGG